MKGRVEMKKRNGLLWLMLFVMAFAFMSGGCRRGGGSGGGDDEGGSGGGGTAARSAIPTSAKPAKDGGFGPKMKGVQLGVVMKDTEFIQLALEHWVLKPWVYEYWQKIYVYFYDSKDSYSEGRSSGRVVEISNEDSKGVYIAEITNRRSSSKVIVVRNSSFEWRAERLTENPELCRIVRYELSAEEFGAKDLPVETFAQEVIDNYGITRMRLNDNSDLRYETYKEDDFNNGWRVEVFEGLTVTVETAQTKTGTSFD
jgi:hypothetical protein